MSWTLLALLCFAGAVTFLVGLAVAAVFYALPRPRLFGFEVRYDD